TGDGEILVVSHTMEHDALTIPIKGRQSFSLSCPSGILSDVVHVLDADGRVMETLPVFEALRQSNLRTYLMPTTDAIEGDKNDCDPLHSNFVRPLGPALAARIGGGIASNDLLISLHNVSALVVMGRADHRIKRIYRGTFLFQHSAQPTLDGQ